MVSFGSEEHSAAEVPEGYAAEDWEWFAGIFKPSPSARFFLGVGEYGRDQPGYRPGRHADPARPAAPKCASRPRVRAAARGARVVRGHPAATRRTVRARHADRRKVRHARNVAPAPMARSPC